MKCAKCGAELKEGCLYCSVCGHEAQMVNEFSVIEEEYLKSILADGAKENRGKEKPASGEKKSAEQKKKKNQLPWMILIIVAVIVVTASIGTIAYVKYKNNNSYDYQMEMAEKERNQHKMEDALSHYKNALALSPNDIEARLAMAAIYRQQKEDDSALVLYMEVITLDKKQKEAYQGLISIYESKNEYGKIKELSENVTDADILALFDPYIVANPVFYPDEGTCDTYTDVTIFSIEDFDVYYTLDGTDPTENGKVCPKDGIELDDVKTYTIKAVCKNEKGIYSDVVTKKYKTIARVPDYPVITPDGGTMRELTFVIITAEENCSIYYTCDGSDPTTGSSRYTGPIQVPEGNNVLSVMVVNDRSKLMSKVYRTNFIYEPTEMIDGNTGN